MRGIFTILTGTLIAVSTAPSSVSASGIRDIIEMPRLSSASLSPDGRWVAYREQRPSIDRNMHDFSWWVVPSDGAAPPKQVSDAGVGDWLNGTLNAEPVIWALDSRSFFHRVARDGVAQIWQTRIDGSSTRAITTEAGNVAKIQVAEGGKALLYSVGASRNEIARAEQAAYDQGVLIDATVDPSRPLIGGAWIDGAWGSERLEGLWFGHAGLTGAAPRAVRRLDLTDGSVRDMPPAVAGEARGLKPYETFEELDGRMVDSSLASGDARGVAYVLMKGKDYQIVVRTAQGDVPCTAALCSQGRILATSWAGNRSTIIFTRRDNAERTSLYRWTVGAPTVDHVTDIQGSLGGQQGSRSGCAIGDRLAICIREDTDQPPALISIDLETGEARTLVQTPDPLDPGESHFVPLEWTDSTGRRFTGHLALPVGAKGPVPLFMTYYNCSGFLRGGTGDDYPLRQMAANGIAALCITAQQLPSRTAVGMRNYRIALDSVRSVIDLLAKRGLVDRARVGMGGVSFGGEVAVYIASHSNLLRAASAANVLLSPTYYWQNAVAGRDIPRLLKQYWGIGSPQEDPQRWQDLSLSSLAPRFKAALLMQVAEQEYRPNVEILAHMQRSGVPAELWGFPGETHIKWQPRHQLAVNERNLDWFRFWLTGEIDPDPAKAAQYARWRAYPSPSHDRAQSSASISGSKR